MHNSINNCTKVASRSPHNTEVVTEPTPIEGEYFGLNSFGVGGANGHLLLTPHTKIKKCNERANDEVPTIVTVSGRTEEAVDYIFNDIEKHYKDEEYVALLHEIFSYDISGHLQRGFIICHQNKPHIRSKTFFSGNSRPIWFVFSGMGSQWPTMGKSLMKLPIFAESIRKTHRVLLEKEIDLIKIITDYDPQLFDNILNSFVGVTAIQIALFDVLKAMGIQPDGIIGHSVGELGCAYADGCLTAEQTILLAYYRGLVSVETPLIRGSMAVVGIGYETMKDLIPAEIEISYHNSSRNCTISGPASITEQFIEQLTKKNVFVRKVNTANIAYHSRYIAPLGPKLISHLKNIILEPKLRSEKWLCTSAPKHEWHTDAVKYSSAEYYTNNLLNPVYFEEGCRLIPNNAVTIEIAPSGILNAILKHSLPETATNVSLTMKNHENGIEFLFNSLGKLYEAGCVPKLSVLYPAVEFPVSKSTPTISSSIKWQHDEQWSIGKLTQQDTITERNFVIQTNDGPYEYVKDHVIDGRNLYPGLGYLWLVLETVAIAQKTDATKIPIVFENVRFERATNVPRKGALKFHVAIQAGSKNFEVSENGTAVATGTIRVLKNLDKEMVRLETLDHNVPNADDEYLSTSDFYKEMRLRGYQYKGMFRNIARANIDGTYAEVRWLKNFVTFMDNMAQLQILNIDTRELLVPTFVRKIVIDFEKHFEMLQSLDKENPVHFYPIHGLLCSGAIQMSGWRGTIIPRQKDPAEAVLEKYHFVPYVDNEEIELNLAIHLCVQIALENTLELQVKTFELLDCDRTLEYPILSSVIRDVLCNMPMVQANVNILKNSDHEMEIKVPNGITISNENLPKDKNCTLIVLSNMRNKADMLENIHTSLKSNGFIIAKEPIVEDINDYRNLGFNVCFSRKINSTEKILLLNKLMNDKPAYKAVELSRDLYTWISHVQNELKTIDNEKNEQLVLYAENDSTNGIIGFFNCIRKEGNGKQLRCVYVMDDGAANFSLEDSFYTSQLDKNLSHNIYKNGNWGCYRHSKVELSENTETPYAICALQERGNLSSFKWVESSLISLKYENSDRNLAYVYYSSLNFRDVMMSVGKISSMDTPFYNRTLESSQGFEFSGKDQKGTRIMGIVNNAAIATMVKTLPLTWKVPAHMTLEEAATIPAVYATIIFAFFFKINLRPGSSILIHAGSGGIGQAAIHLCLYYKCTIFTTVGTPEKVEFIRQTFPQIPKSHIGNSRDTSFETLIKQQTNGRGVDVVLNSLSEEKLQASVRCLATHGNFLEIGRFDMIKNNPLELGHFVKNISFHSIQLDVIMDTSPQLTRELRDKLQTMLDQKIIKPIQRSVFQSDDVESALRHMTSGKHTGKILIKIRDEENESPYAKPIPIKIKAKPRIICQKTDCYIIIGGLGGLGMELADWLIVRGARNIVLSSRTGIKNGYQSYRIKLWRSYDVKVIIFIEDVTKEIGVKNLFLRANSLGPVKGIFNLAVILKDDSFSQQTKEHFRIANEPKAIITRHLDNLSRRMCPQLQHFVVFSSAVCGLGNQNQTNYGYANSEMERICERRHAANLPALAIQWGAVGEAGIVAEMVEQNAPNITIAGTLPQKLKSCLEALDLFMKQASSPIVSSMVVAEKRRLDSNIVNTVANILGIKDLKTINQSWTLPELGMDSIIAIELKQILESEFNVIFSPEDIRNMTFVKLNQMKEGKQNVPKSGEKVKTQIQIFMNEILSNKCIRRIPFNENYIEKSIVFDESPTVFMFPGMEGLAVMMEPLAKYLPGQKLCFQYYFGEVADFPMNKLQDYFAAYILNNFNLYREFCLIAHSMGGLIALGVADILEKHGKRVYLCLIECSPLYFKQKQITVEPNANEAEIQNVVCIRVMRIMTPIKATDENIELVKNKRDWQSKKKLCFSLLSSVLEDEKALDKLFNGVYNQFKALLDYEIPQVSLESCCTLIRCAENSLDLDEAYSLSKYFKNPIKIHKVDADHVTIIRHPQSSKIIMECPIWKK